MNERRREAADLGGRLARHRQRQARTAVALVELERRPGYRLLDAATHGRTGERCAAARATRARLWRDFARYTDLVGATSAPTRGRLDDADALVTGVRAALHALQALASACETARSSALAALVPVVERLAGARRTVAVLELAADDPDAVAATELTARAAQCGRDATGDPLASPATHGPDGPVAALCARLDALVRLRDGWSAVVADLDRQVVDVGDRRARVLRERARAGAEVCDTIPARPPDRGPELRALRAAVSAADGWRGRHDAVVALRERVADARRDLDARAALVAELLDRRDDLRGRFGAYRARSRRPGHGDDPELTELAGRIGTRLWAVPSEVARATRDLAAYRRRLAALSAA